MKFRIILTEARNLTKDEVNKILKDDSIIDEVFNFLKSHSFLKEVYVKFFVKQLKELSKDLSKDGNYNYSKIFKMFNSEFIEIIDWIKGRGQLNGKDDYPTKLPLKSIDFRDAVKQSEIWHKSLKTSSKAGDDEGITLKTYDDGFYWQNLQTSYSKQEADLMGHCANAGHGYTLYSLRKRDHNNMLNAYITIAVDGDTYTQCKGPENQHPNEKYYKYILDLFDVLNISEYDSSYRSDLDFQIIDVLDYDEELFYKYIKKYPNLLQIEHMISVYNEGNKQLLSLIIEHFKNMPEDKDVILGKDTITLIYDNWNDEYLKYLYIEKHRFYLDYLTGDENLDYYDDHNYMTYDEQFNLLNSDIQKKIESIVENKNLSIEDYIESNEKLKNALNIAESIMFETSKKDKFLTDIESPLVEFLGEPKWKNDKLQFTLTYDRYLDILGDFGSIVYAYNFDDFRDAMCNSLYEGASNYELLSVDIPYNGYYGDIDEEHFNEVFNDNFDLKDLV